MFFALKGDNFNGNKFVADAFKRGAKYCVVDEDEGVLNTNCIRVDDVLQTLQKLATYHRRAIGIKIIALTGSNGKTTTKELINAVLSSVYNVKATVGNLNNHIGVPLTLLGFTQELDYGIVEMGANHQKEIEFLSQLTYPDYVVITNYGKAHLEGFGGVEGIIKGKSELYDFARLHDKSVFINTDDPIQIDQINDYSNVITFGSSRSSDVVINFLNASPFVHFHFGEVKCQSQLIGAYNFQNIAIAVAIGSYFNVPDNKIKSAIESYIPANNRSQIITKGTNKVILDAYNANPTSMLAALKSFHQLEDKNKYLLLGDMFELGEDSIKEHQAIADFAKQNFDANIFLIGEYFSQIKAPDSIHKFVTFEALKNDLKTKKIENACLLIKASRGMALERILELL